MLSIIQELGPLSLQIYTSFNAHITSTPCIVHMLDVQESNMTKIERSLVHLRGMFLIPGGLWTFRSKHLDRV